MKRILFLLFAISLLTSETVTAAMSTSKVREETRFLTDKMAYELNLNTLQYNDVYEINFDFVYSLRDVMGYVTSGYEWALSDYYEALDVRNDDLRWVLSDAQYRRFLGADYFYRPIYVTGGSWNFRIYLNYPNRSLFYFGVPHHYLSYSGAHYRGQIHYNSHYRGRHSGFNHYATPYRVRDQRVFSSYRRSDFGTVQFRSNSSVRPHNAPTRQVRTNSTTNRRTERSTPTTTAPNRSVNSINKNESKSSTSSRENGAVRRNNNSERRSSNSSSSRSNVSSGQTERRSSSEATRSNSNRSSSRSTERDNGARR